MAISLVNHRTDEGLQVSFVARRYRDKVWRVIVSVCPAAVTPASPDQIWRVLSTPERFGEWTDATYMSSDPAGPLRTGQTIRLTARSLGRHWPIDIEVRGMDPRRRWIDLLIRLPFGIENHEHVSMTETERGTLVRFN